MAASAMARLNPRPRSETSLAAAHAGHVEVFDHHNVRDRRESAGCLVGGATADAAGAAVAVATDAGVGGTGPTGPLLEPREPTVRPAFLPSAGFLSANARHSSPWVNASFDTSRHHGAQRSVFAFQVRRSAANDQPCGSVRPPPSSCFSHRRNGGIRGRSSAQAQDPRMPPGCFITAEQAPQQQQIHPFAHTRMPTQLATACNPLPGPTQLLTVRWRTTARAASANPRRGVLGGIPPTAASPRSCPLRSSVPSTAPTTARAQRHTGGRAPMMRRRFPRMRRLGMPPLIAGLLVGIAMLPALRPGRTDRGHAAPRHPLPRVLRRCRARRGGVS